MVLDQLSLPLFDSTAAEHSEHFQFIVKHLLSYWVLKNNVINVISV